MVLVHVKVTGCCVLGFQGVAMWMGSVLSVLNVAMQLLGCYEWFMKHCYAGARYCTCYGVLGSC